MTQALDLDKSTRLLIVVPHPDDETLATGGLIQKALTGGARLRVVIVTDGDNNPWPQRWIEKRWRIDSKARERWGARRRLEADEALARFGVSKQDVRHYGWPDQGLTERLMHDAQCEDQLVAEIENFAPTLIAAPSLADLHPDHNALRVILELALSRTAFADCSRLGFVVHGPLATCDGLVMPANEEEARQKQFALQAHASQLVLSGKRMVRIGRRIEQFEFREHPSVAATDAACLEWQMVYPQSGFRLHRRALLLVVKVGRRVFRASLPMPGRFESPSQEVALDSELSLRVQLQISGSQLRIKLSSEHAPDLVFAKIERLGPRIFIYDASGWQQVE